MRISIRLKPVYQAIRIIALLGCLAGIVTSAGVAVAAEPLTGGLTIHSDATGGAFSEGESPNCTETEGAAAKACYGYQVTVLNSGGGTAEGPIVVKEHLPSGFTVSNAVLFLDPAVGNGRKGGVHGEELSGACSSEGEPVTVTCTYESPLAPDEALELRLFVSVSAGTPSGQLSTASVTAPGSPEASVTEPLLVSSAPAAFGPSALVSYIASGSGGRATQASAHPYELATRIDLRNVVKVQPEGLRGLTSVHDVKDVIVDLPMGLLGDTQATPTCTFGQLESVQHCPADTRVGQIQTEPEDATTAYIGIYNMVPEHGVAAEFGFIDAIDSTHAIYANVAPTPAGYVLRATSRQVPQIPLTNVTAIFFGNPAAKDEAGNASIAMFTNPSDCSGEPLVSTVHMDSWQEPGRYNSNASPAGEPEVNGSNWATALSDEWPVGGTVTPATTGTVTGCNQLRFNPSAFTFAPEEAHSRADEPSGYESVLRIPQTETPGTLATPPLKMAVVTLPPGVAVSPSAADGLVGCQESGSEGINFESAGAGHCPAASKVGKVEVITPVLEEPLTGSVFVAQPKCGGPVQPECTEEAAETGGIFAIYMEVENENRGIHVKLKGKVEVGGNGQYSQTHGLQPGQIRTSFIETPQVAVFSELRLKFNGGPRAPLANPQTCGAFTINANLEPWSAPESGPNAIEEPSFNIGGCENRFASSFSAGTVNNQAGGYSPFTTTFSRQDREQDLSGITVNMPEGLLGKIAGIEQCPENEANAGTCGSIRPGSHIGTATAAAGSGSHPFWQSGNVYLTGPYKNAPFGLSVVVPAKAGPYNLGNIVVRAAIYINPNTAAATIVSDPLPQSVDGVPLRVQTVNVTVGQANNFTFNATNCTEKTIGATLTSAQGAQANVSSRYQAANCQSLPFKPQFTVSTQGKTSKADGASLSVKIAYPSSGQANIAKVDLQFPKILPARLTTLQKACTEAQFNTNPAGCPVASDIATVTVHTPLLNSPLTGPAYFVSHGGAAFPDVELVLQGEGVLLVVDGKTQIKKGITYSHFDTTPDAPFSAFEFNAPEGPFSILTANGSLCDPTTTKTVKKRVAVRAHGHVKHVTRSVRTTVPESLVMPTTITAQNGAVINQSTKIAVTGCPKVKKAKIKKKVKGHGGKGGKGKKR